MLDKLNLHQHLDNPGSVPLQVIARYTRIEILTACGIGEGARVCAWQTGVYRAGDVNPDLLAFTLDKTDDGFSPTTRYRVYAISRDLIHWESQNVTLSDGETGLRYQNHENTDNSILMFARERMIIARSGFLGLRVLYRMKVKGQWLLLGD